MKPVACKKRRRSGATNKLALSVPCGKPTNTHKASLCVAPRGGWWVVPSLLVFTLLLPTFGSVPAYGDYAVNWCTVDGGGGKATVSRNDTWTVRGTAGQPDAGLLQAGSYVVSGGFWSRVPGAPLAHPDYPHHCRKNRFLSFLANKQTRHTLEYLWKDLRSVYRLH